MSVKLYMGDEHMNHEIGGYIELDQYRLPMRYEDGILLNSGRSALQYLLKARSIQKIAIPWFCCDSVRNACIKVGVAVRQYNINEKWLPDNVDICDEEWIYIVNCYGQLTPRDIYALKNKFERVIVDNAQAYFSEPLSGVDTIYTCRKYFGVPDGGVLYSDTFLADELPLDTSYQRMNFLLGRFEGTASDFYDEYVLNNKSFAEAGIKRMSILTRNLLHGLDYGYICQKREDNFSVLAEMLDDINFLTVIKPKGPFAYPLLLENGAEIRRKLISKKIYIPCLWPNVLTDTPKDSWEYELANNILPLPVDQRYGLNDMKYLVDMLKESINQ